jgi:hypothetical protein
MNNIIPPPPFLPASGLDEVTLPLPGLHDTKPSAAVVVSHCGKIVGRNRHFRSSAGSYLESRYDGVLQWKLGEVTKRANFEIIPIGRNCYHVKSWQDKFVSSMANGDLTADTPRAGPCAALAITQVGPGTFSIKTVHGKFVSAGPSVCVRADDVGPAETITIEPLNEGKYGGEKRRLRDRPGYVYVQNSDVVRCDEFARGRELFNIVTLGRNQYHIQSCKWGKYLAVGGDGALVASSTSPEALGIFTIEKKEDAVAIKTSRGKYVVVPPHGKVLADGDVPTLFIPEPPFRSKFAGINQYIRSCHGSYLSVRPDGIVLCAKGWWTAGNSEKFELVPVGRSGYYIRTRIHTWLTLIEDGYKVAAKPINTPGMDQTFFIKQVADNGKAISFMTCRGTYLSARLNGSVDAARDGIGEFEVFTLG